jgi:hypothetical protein
VEEVPVFSVQLNAFFYRKPLTYLHVVGRESNDSAPSGVFERAIKSTQMRGVMVP